MTIVVGIQDPSHGYSVFTCMAAKLIAHGSQQLGSITFILAADEALLERQG